MSVTGHIIGNWNLTGEVNETGEGANVVPNPPEEATDTLEKIGIDDVVYSITGEQEQADWDQSDPTAVDYIKNKPTIPVAQVNSDWDAASGVAQILNKPTIPAAQVNSDWNAISGVAEILNKPNLANVATSGSYNDLTDKPDLSIYELKSEAFSGDYDDLTNKPTIPTKTSDLTNDSGYITSSALPTNYVTTDTVQNITGEKTFVGTKRIKFKQSTSSDKLGFTLYDRSNNEKGYLTDTCLTAQDKYKTYLDYFRICYEH